MAKPDASITFKLRDELVTYIEKTYGAKPEHLWERYPEYMVFRHKKVGTQQGKWFCLIANVTYAQLGIKSETDDVIFVAVVKSDPGEVSELVKTPGFARGYHMNKETWLSVLLDGQIPMDRAKQFVDISYELTR